MKAIRHTFSSFILYPSSFFFMIAARLTPKLLTYVMAIHLALWLGFRLPAQFELTSRHLIIEGIIRTVGLALAYLCAFALNLEIAAEYRKTPWLRVAWIALALNAGISIVRMIIEYNLYLVEYIGAPLFKLLQHLAIVPANGFLLLGLVAMWWAYHKVGLGFKIQVRDWAAISGILILICAIFWFREGLTEANSPYEVSRYLQLAGLVLLLLSGAASLVLHRMAIQMEGGKLAIALNFLTLYTILRGILVFAGAVRRISEPESPLLQPSNIQFIIQIGWLIVPWIAVLAAAHRAELTVQAAKELEQQRASRNDLVSV
jgi:hypothetical protein